MVLVRFATERLLYHLSRSPHADRFVLEGSWLFYVWDLERRVTRDLDLLGFGNASWRTFLGWSGGAASAPASFPGVVDRIRELVLAPLEAARGGA